MRSYQQMLIVVRKDAFTPEELVAVREFASSRAFDLVFLPGIHPDETNLYNILEEPVYYQAFTGVLDAADRDTWYEAYDYDVRPPTDDRPFFDHYFTWQQAPDVLKTAGYTWQPFGGAGYFVVVALLLVALIAAGCSILLPLAVEKRQRGTEFVGLIGYLVYFSLLGLAYLFVEMPLLQQFILFLGQPAYATAVVLFALLLFSGLGSLISDRLPLVVVLFLIPALVGGYALALPVVLRWALPASQTARVGIAILALAPLALLMGMPFPKGLAMMEGEAPGLVGLAWGANGALSVVASILATLLALGAGLTTVLVLGALCYAGAGLSVVLLRRRVTVCPHR
jgi:hypothetical protein